MNPSASSGGLVRRRTAAENSTDNNGSNSSTSNNDHNDNFKDDADNDNMEETSDKETRLTLMEEVLLLGLKDKEVSLPSADCPNELQCWHVDVLGRRCTFEFTPENKNRESEI